MKNIKNELMEKMTEHSVNEERLMELVHLATYMMGKINICDGCISENDEINNNYSGWLESLLDTISNVATEQTKDFDEIMQEVDKLQ